MGKQKIRNFSKSGRKKDLEYFCEIGMILWLRQNLEMAKKIFAELKLDLEYFCPKRIEKRTRT